MACSPEEVITSAELTGLKSDIETIDAVVESSLDTTTTKSGTGVNTLKGQLKLLGYEPPIAYVSSILFTVNDNIKTVEEVDIVYAPLPSALPFTTSGVFIGDDDSRFFVIQQGQTKTIKNYGAVGDGVTDDSAVVEAAMLLGKEIIFEAGDYLIGPNTPLADGSVLKAGSGRNETEITWAGTGVGTDYGVRLTEGNAIEGVTINATCNATSVPNSRTNGVIYGGPDGSSGDDVIRNTSIKNVFVNRDGTGAPITNAVQFFNDTSDNFIENLVVEGEFSNGIQYHWNYAASGLTTNHPRRISNKNCLMNDTSGNNESLSFSWRGAHDVWGEMLHARNGNQIFTFSAGDRGELTGPDPESILKVMSNLNLHASSSFNGKNEGVWFAAVSGPDVPGSNNKRWIGCDSPAVGGNVIGHTNLKGPASINNTTLYMTGMNNLHARNVITALGTGASITDTTPAIVVDTSTNCDVQSRSNCATAVDVLSGRNIDLDITHENSDKANSVAATGIKIRGVVHTSTIASTVPIGGTTITLDLITDNIYKGMRFYHGLNEFVFAQSAVAGSASHNTNIVLAIEPAVAAINSGQTVEMMRGGDYIRVKADIKDANKGVTVLGTDHRLCRGIEIDLVETGSIARKIEVSHGGIVVKYNGMWMFNDLDGGYGVTITGDNTPNATVIMFSEVGDNQKVGYGHQAPTRITISWSKGDVIWDRDLPNTGWRCSVASVINVDAGTWVAF